MTNQNNEKSKNGKRIALILLALLLIAAIAFGAYTYSKYITSGEGSGSATVAKWGFDINVQSGENKGFSTSYDNNGYENEAGLSIVSSSENNVVAPGAKGEITFSLSGEAEVAALAKIIITNSEEISLSFVSGGITYTYYPIQYTLTDNNSSESDKTVASGNLADIIAYLNGTDDTIFSSGKSIEANIDPAINYNYTLSWEWAFERTDGLTLYKDALDETGIKLSGDNVNILDTYLGQIADGNEAITGSTQTVELAKTSCTVNTNNAKTTVKFSIEVNVEQVRV